MRRLHTKIEHPDWMGNVNAEMTFRLYREGKLPKRIEGWMLVTSCRHALRCIYGSDLKAAWLLLLEAIHDVFTWRIRVPFTSAFYNIAFTVAQIETRIETMELEMNHRLPVWGRYESPEPVRCESCGWGGMRRWTIHTYKGQEDDGLESADECPCCGDEI